MKKIQWIMGLTIAMVILAACGRTAYVQKDTNVDLSKIQTYSWVKTQTDKESKSNNGKTDDLTARKIRESIDRNLQAKGWREVNRNPDVYLVYDVMIENEDVRVQRPVYSESFTRWFFNPRNRRWVPVFYPSRVMGYDEQTRQVKEGTLTLTMLDADTDKTIWQGWTTSELNGRKLTDKEIDGKVKAIVKKIAE
jgi:hypothetical protein